MSTDKSTTFRDVDSSRCPTCGEVAEPMAQPTVIMGREPSVEPASVCKNGHKWRRERTMKL